MIRHIALALALAAALCAETFEDRQKATDMSDAEQVYALAQWCAENRLPSRAQQLYRQVLKIDRNHYGANTALGNVLVGDRWVNRQFAPKGGAAPAPAAGAGDAPRPSVAGPGPAAKDVAWDLTVPADPGPEQNDFLDGFIRTMRSARNDSDAMGSAVATLIREDNWPSAMPRLCKAMAAGGYGDVYGASEIVIELHRQGRHREIRRLFPFIVKASEGVTDAEDLEHFAMVATMVRDRKVVPRLIELLDHPAKQVQDATKDSLSAITRLPVKDITPERTKQWWDANWSLSEDQVMLEQLRSSDQLTAVEAAMALCDMRNKEIFPVLFKLLRSDDPAVVRRAVEVLRRATTQDWQISVSLSPEDRAKRVALVEKWWKEESIRFNWPGLPSESTGSAAAALPKADPDRQAVDQLASTTGNEAQEAERRLRSRAEKAVPALLVGLEHGSPLVRRRAHDILREVSKQDFGYDPRGDEAKRATAVQEWRKWAVTQKLVEAPGADEEAPAEDGK